MRRTTLPTTGIRRVRGVTLVELLVVMSLMAALLFVAVPNVAEWIRNVRVRATAESIASGVNEARMEAIRRNQVVSFWLVNSPGVVGTLDSTCVRSASSGSWVVSLDDPTGACGAAQSVNDAPRLVASKAVGTAGESVNIAAADLSGTPASALAFNGFGQPVTGVGGVSLATIDVTSTSTGARRLRIAVSTGGDVRMCDRDVSGTDPRRCL